MRDAYDDAQINAAGRLRDVMHALMGYEQDPKVLGELATELERRLPTLTAGAVTDRSVEDWADFKATSYVPPDGGYFENDLRRPMSGKGNPFSVPYDVLRNGDLIEAHITLRPGFEGAPKRSHGGVVAAIFDDLAGYLLAMLQRMAFTAWIRVDYKAPTPIGEPLVYRAWVEKVEERKLLVGGDCLDEAGTLIATCEALFITPRNG